MDVSGYQKNIFPLWTRPKNRTIGVWRSKCAQAGEKPSQGQSERQNDGETMDCRGYLRGPSFREGSVTTADSIAL
jgi:hypothetical protein